MCVHKRTDSPDRHLYGQKHPPQIVTVPIELVVIVYSKLFKTVLYILFPLNVVLFVIKALTDGNAAVFITCQGMCDANVDSTKVSNSKEKARESYLSTYRFF